MAIQVRKSTYRGDDGFLICGVSRFGHRLAIFTETKDGAERIRKAYNDETLTMEECWEVTGRVFTDEKLEEFRTAIHEERISWGELAELQAMADLIDPDDDELLAWAE